jgi:hypothetical protein
MSGATRPVLPALADGANELPVNDQLEQARYNTLFHDKESGKWYQQIQEGEWVEVPLDDAGLPMYEPVLPAKKGA